MSATFGDFTLKRGVLVKALEAQMREVVLSEDAVLIEARLEAFEAELAGSHDAKQLRRALRERADTLMQRARAEMKDALRSRRQSIVRGVLSRADALPLSLRHGAERTALEQHYQRPVRRFRTPSLFRVLVCASGHYER